MMPPFFSTRRPSQRSTLFPYTTLFRSAYYVHPVNIQTACLIMEGAEFTENIINGVERPVKAINNVRSEERFSRNAETDLVCRLLLEKKKILPKVQINTIVDDNASGELDLVTT